MKKNENFFKVYPWMGELDITTSEMYVYALIYTFSMNTPGYFGSVNTVSTWTKFSRRTVQRALRELLRVGLIEKASSGKSPMYRAIKPRHGDTIWRHGDALEGDTVTPQKRHGDTGGCHDVTPGVSQWRSKGDMVTPKRKERNNKKKAEKKVRESSDVTPSLEPQLRGRYNNVLLTDRQYLELGNEFGPYARDDYIERVSEYMEGHGKKYQNHEAIIREWIRRDRDRKPMNKDEKHMAFFSQFFTNDEEEINT